eukprot:CAMPEP_0196661586 /NCGR_PEP_ID=MMETSP1086-20130531/45006_1 /TAXON_ID=77921 /ORGANISM="Cyanoptyche  gloeocystis , Strain SAG4.97" /LENGTH=181 /DNA_ID=CAMNT_0041996551 /DNA_START=90 /DNA_END=632 /DNA_ORIENTATION=-
MRSTGASSSSVPLYDISGRWDRTITLRPHKSTEWQVLFDALSTQKNALIVPDDHEHLPNDSHRVWAAVNVALYNRRDDVAADAKADVEDRARADARQRQVKNIAWTPEHFEETSSDARALKWRLRTVSPELRDQLFDFIGTSVIPGTSRVLPSLCHPTHPSVAATTDSSSTPLPAIHDISE